MKVAIIGLGAISPLHIEAVKSLGGKIVAICDVDKTKVARANEEYSLGANEYTNYVEMLDNESLDVVHICTPHYLHAPMAEEALARDINVLTEKPLAINERQLEELETAVGKSRGSGCVFRRDTTIQRGNSKRLSVRKTLKRHTSTSYG